MIEKPKLEYFTLEQIRNLIASVKDSRDKLMLRTMYETGCTPSELTEIKKQDIAGNMIKIRNGCIRFARISGNLAKDLSLYINGNKLENYVFSTRQSQRMTEKRVRQLVQKYTKESGIALNPIMLRYYHIAHAYVNGVFIEEIAKQLGLTKFRIFQVLQELNIAPKGNNYYNFLRRVG